MDPLFIRSSIIEELALLSSGHAQLRYEQSVPTANIPAELVCGWFDDIYHPDTREFQQAFSRSELAALAGFSALFELQVSSMPDTVRELVKLATWQQVMQQAREALSTIQGRADGS